MNVIRMPGIREAPRSVRSRMDTLGITLRTVDGWKKPPFQRDLRETPKVKALVPQIRLDSVIPGIITLGTLEGETYLVDGQHRTHAFRMACDPALAIVDSAGRPIPVISEAYADVRICTFDDMGEMGEEFVNLSSALVRMRNDDILRGLEGVNEHLAKIRARCPFIAYGNVRMPGSKKVLQMSTAVRVWFGSEGATPTPGPASTEAAKMLDENEAKRLCAVLTTCFEAWGADPENFRLWGSLNLSLTFWLWRRLVLREGLAVKRGGGGLTVTTLTPDNFRQCLMAAAANQQYVEWLLGRGLRDRDRSPAYNRLKAIFAGRIGGMAYGRAILPGVEWASH